MESRRIVITGATRGIGLAMARNLIGKGHTVWGTTRNLAVAHDLRDAGAEGVLQLDIGNGHSIAAFGRSIAEHTDRIDVLVNNAGAGTNAFGVERADAGPWDVDPDVVLDVTKVNALGPMRVTREVIGLLEAGTNPLVVNTSSQLGSMVVGPRVQDTPYNVSKAALNMITVMMAASKPDVAFVSLHPGWVRTDMGGPSATLDADDAAESIVEAMLALTIADSGRFINWDGSNHPW